MPLPGPGQPARVAAAAATARRTAPADGARRHTHAPRAPLAAGQAALRQPAAGLADPAAVRGLPADPMRSARETPGDAQVTGGSVRPGFTPSGARIGRNEPCWCGSGQKYKKCHGA